MSKFISLVMAPYLALDLYFPSTYWLALLRDSMCIEKSTFPRLPTPTFSIWLLFLFYVSVNDTMRNLGFTKFCYFYLVNAMILYLLCTPVLIHQSFLDFCIEFPSHIPSLGLVPLQFTLKCESVPAILLWIPFPGPLQPWE